MIDLLAYLPTRRKQTSSGWLSFNAPCCVHNGQSADRRQRGGIKATLDSWSFHCFNCRFTASWQLGRNLSIKARKFLSWVGVSEHDIEMLNIESLRHRSIHGIIEDRQRTAELLLGIKFKERDLPPAAELLSPEHGEFWQYARNRCVPENFPLMTQILNDGVHWTRPHVIVPFTYDNKIVGYVCRFIDNKQPKFINDTQPGYVFGTDLQHDNWQHVLVMEGVFDAICIGGVAVLHNDINDAQARLIRNLGKEITVVPDHDSAGMALVDRAVELGWAVSMPDWPAGIKDVNDAVVTFGRLAALLTIMQARETSRIKIEIRKKQIVKKLQ